MKKAIVALSVMAAFAVPAIGRNHVGFVNVGGAVDRALLGDTVTNGLQNVVQIFTRIYEEPSINVADLVGKASMGYPKGERQLCVYFVDTKDLPSQVTVPGFFAIINVRGLRKDADDKKYANRILKMALKGLAFACGFGANQDVGRCVMGAGSFDTLKGIDGTSATYSPFCYFPLNDYLLKRGVVDDTPPEY